MSIGISQIRSEPHDYYANALTFKIARYVIGDDAIIAVRINTNGNGINNNYNNNTIKARVRMEGGG